MYACFVFHYQLCAQWPSFKHTILKNELLLRCTHELYLCINDIYVLHEIELLYGYMRCV